METPLKWRSLGGQEAKYEYILEQIKKGNIRVVKKEDAPSDEYIEVKNTAIYININDIGYEDYLQLKYA